MEQALVPPQEFVLEVISYADLLIRHLRLAINDVSLKSLPKEGPITCLFNTLMHIGRKLLDLLCIR